MSTTEELRDIRSPATATIAEAATKQLALEKAYKAIDGYVAELAPDTTDPFTREIKSLEQSESKDLKQPNDG